MSEERLQEIKDSVDFQKQILMAHNMETLCVDEEQELIEEIERLKNIIKEVREYIEWLRKEHHKTENVGYTKAVYNTNELLVILHKLEGE